jgi:RHS repeat-associated protein
MPKVRNGHGSPYDDAGDQVTDSTGETEVYNQLSQTTTFNGSVNLNPTYRGAGQGDRTTVASGLLTGSVSPTDSALGTTSIKNTTLLGLGLGGNDNTTPGGTQVIRDPAGNLLGISITSSLLNLGLGGTTTNFTYATDDQGSVAAVYAANQQAEDTYAYDPYGNTTATEAAPQPFRFQGQYEDATGLYHMGQRYYDPTTGRWLQMDPDVQVTDPTQSNPYAFAGSDPVNNVDASGLLFGCKHIVSGDCHVDLGRLASIALGALLVHDKDLGVLVSTAALSTAVCPGFSDEFAPLGEAAEKVAELVCAGYVLYNANAVASAAINAYHRHSCISIRLSSLYLAPSGVVTDAGSGCRNL